LSLASRKCAPLRLHRQTLDLAGNALSYLVETSVTHRKKSFMRLKFDNHKMEVDSEAITPFCSQLHVNALS